MKTARLIFRATPAEADAIRLMADAALMGTSEFLRRRALGEDMQVRRLAALHAELRKLGGLQKHLVMQRTWSVSDRDQFESVMRAFILAAKSVQDALDAR
ncbi:hypothetical protein GALL_321200 [mine drainage metagenome]|jgi:hypothetical protein|uniref:Mobilization protein MobB n=1 Tax=mine drainage metagenome TaxID=410659 RepID=A0A1J5QQZ6_9ZZZZ